MIVTEKAALCRKNLCISKLDLSLSLLKCYVWNKASVVLKIEHLQKWVQNILKVLKCGAGERWRRSVGPIV